jgi:hypothetical protein
MPFETAVYGAPANAVKKQWPVVSGQWSVKTGNITPLVACYFLTTDHRPLTTAPLLARRLLLGYNQRFCAP